MAATERLRVIFSSVCLLLGFSIFGAFAWSIRVNYNFPIEVYWLSFVFVSIPLLCEVFFWHSSQRLRLIYLVSFALIIHLQYAVIDVSPFLSSSDAIFDYKLTNQIMASFKWVPGEAIERAWQYSFYPVSNFLYAITSMVSGIPLMLVVKYLFVAKAFLFPPIIFKWYQNFFDQNVSYLATVILLASPGALLFPHKEPLALIFFVIGLFAITKMIKTWQRGFLAIGFLSVAVLIMTHHFTSYIFLGVLASVSLIGYAKKHKSVVKPSNQFLLFCLVFFLAWVIFIAYAMALMWERLTVDVLLGVLTPQEVQLGRLMPTMLGYEKVIIWSGYGITVLCTMLGFFTYMRNRKERSVDFAAISLLFLTLVAVSSLFRFAPHQLNLEVAHRAYEFGYFAIGPLAAFMLVKMSGLTKKPALKSALKLILICAVIMMLIIGPMENMSPRSPTAKLARVLSPDALSLNTWMARYGGKSNIIGDYEVAHLIFDGYGERKWIILYPRTFSEPVVNFTELENEGITGTIFVVTYNYMTKIWVLNQSSLTKFDRSVYFQRVQSNGEFTIYQIHLNATPP